MARVSDWFDEWAFTLRSRSGRSDWLDSTSPSGRAFWEDFESSLVRIGATFELADQASSIVADVPDLFPNQFRPMILEAIRKLQKDQQTGISADPLVSLEAAKFASRECIDCQGAGLVSRYVESRGGYFGFLCRCPMAHWIKAQHGDKCPFREVPRDLPKFRPAEVKPPDIRTPADLKAYMASLAASKDAPGPFVPPPPRRRDGDDARAVPARAELADAIGDPVIDRELAKPAPKPAAMQSLTIPEDDWTQWP